MNHITHLILPVGLFEINPYLLPEKDVVVYEDPYYFTRLPFHKQKLVLHRASMKSYFDSMNHNRKRYVAIDQELGLPAGTTNVIEVIDPHDYPLLDKLQTFCKKNKVRLNILSSPNFLLDKETIESLDHTYYRHDQKFYPFMRQRCGIDIPLNGKSLTYDAQNREKIPKEMKLPPFFTNISEERCREAITYVEARFPHHPGVASPFVYPFTHAMAKKALERFCEVCLPRFGKYEDALGSLEDIENHPSLFHSALSSSLNNGLLTDKQVLRYVMKYARDHVIPLNSLEGYIRQLIGWRNYVLFVYEKEGERIRSMNFMNHHGKLSKRWWDGTTGMPLVDAVIRKVQRYAYAHHIERLMVLGSFMMMCMIDPNEVNDWFTSFVSIDAYDVFMIPNVNGMSQHADGGILMSRPYFSSSSYLKKMVTGKIPDSTIRLKSGEYPWDQVYDAVYYNFIGKHEKYLATNYATSRQVWHWNRKDVKERQRLCHLADDYLAFLHT